MADHEKLLKITTIILEFFLVGLKLAGLKILIKTWSETTEFILTVWKMPAGEI